MLLSPFWCHGLVWNLAVSVSDHYHFKSLIFLFITYVLLLSAKEELRIVSVRAYVYILLQGQAYFYTIRANYNQNLKAISLLLLIFL